MNHCGLTASITAVANAIANNLNVEETTLLAAILVQLGDTLATIATLKTLCETKDNSSND